MKYLILFITLSQLSFSITYDELSPAEKFFYHDLSPYVKTLDREIWTYNWLEDSELEKFNLSNHQELVKFYRSAWTTYLPSKDRNHQGAGLYTAIDPIISEGFGNLLARVTFPKGMKFLDTREDYWDGSYPMRFFTYQKFKQEGCDLLNKWERFGLNKSNFSANKKCHQILLNTVSALDIDAIAYPWNEY